MAKRRKVRVVHGTARFTSPNDSTVETATAPRRSLRARDHRRRLALGAAPRAPADDPRVHGLDLRARARGGARSGCWSSAAGIIGLEMATVYDALGSRVTVVELLDRLIPGADPDLVRAAAEAASPAATRRSTCGTRVAEVEAREDGLHGRFDGRRRSRDGSSTACWSRSAAARTATASAPTPPGSRSTSAASSPSTSSMRTNVRAHLRDRRRRARADARPQGDPRGHVAAEVIAGHDVAFDARGDPVGRLHGARGRLGRPHGDRGQGEGRRRRGGRRIPWAASGRRARHGAPRGATKLVSTRRRSASWAPASSARTRAS